MVRRELVTACRLAGSPTSRSPLSVKATTLGVRRLPSWLGITFTSPPSMTATTELVVPKSIPIIFSSAMFLSPFERGFSTHFHRQTGAGIVFSSRTSKRRREVVISRFVGHFRHERPYHKQGA